MKENGFPPVFRTPMAVPDTSRILAFCYFDPSSLVVLDARSSPTVRDEADGPRVQLVMCTCDTHI
jgi:hypothetical protein